MSIAGDLCFNPISDSLENREGKKVRLNEPSGIDFPVQGFAVEDDGFQAPVEDGRDIEVIINPISERLQLLSPFEPWDENNITGMNLLIKTI